MADSPEGWRPVWRKHTFLAMFCPSEPQGINKKALWDEQKMGVVDSFLLAAADNITAEKDRLEGRQKVLVEEVISVLNQVREISTLMAKAVQNTEDTKLLASAYDVFNRVMGCVEAVVEGRVPQAAIPAQCQQVTAEEEGTKFLTTFLLIQREPESEGELRVHVINAGDGLEYHPFSGEDYPKARHRTVLELRHLPRRPFLDESVWWVLAQNAVFERFHADLRGSDLVYEMILPHLCGGVPLEEVLKRSADAHGNNPACPFEVTGGIVTDNQTVQSLLKHLLRERALSEALFEHPHLRMLRDVQDSLDECASRKEPIFEADRLFINHALRQIASDAASMDRPELELMTQLNDRIDGLLERTEAILLGDDDVKLHDTPAHVIDKIAAPGAAPGSVTPSVQCQPLPHMELLDFPVKTSRSCGSLVEDGTSVFVDLCNTREGEITTFREAMRVIEKTEQICRMLQSKGELMSRQVCNQQLVSLVEHTYSSVIPVPKPHLLGQHVERDSSKREKSECFWRALSCNEPNVKAQGSAEAAKLRRQEEKKEVELEAYQQRLCLKLLYDTSVHYITALSKVGTHASVGSGKRSITLGSILAMWDATLRMWPDEWKPDELLLSDICMGRTTPSKHPLWLSGSPIDGIRDLKVALEAVQVHSPHLLAARDAVLRYFTQGEACNVNSSVLFNWTIKSSAKDKRDAIFEVRDDEPVLTEVVSQVLSKRNLNLEKSPVPSHLQKPRTLPKNVSKAASLAAWLRSDWSSEPEVQMMRDLVFFFKLSLDPGFDLSADDEKGDDLVTSGDRRLTWACKATGKELSLKCCFWSGRIHPEDGFRVMTLKNKLHMSLHSLAFSHIMDPDEKNKMQATMGTYVETILKARVTLEDVLYAKYLPDFSQELSLEESEHLLSYCCVPSSSIPFILSFFQDRPGLLLNKELREIICTALFQPGEFSADPDKRVTEVPLLHEERRDMLGTSMGILLFEVSRCPLAVLQPLCRLCHNAGDICIGDSDAMQELLSITVTMVLTVERYVHLVLGVQGSPRPKNSQQARKMMAELRKWLTGVATTKLRSWLAQAEANGDTSTMFHCHLQLALIEINDSALVIESSDLMDGDRSKFKPISSWLVSAAFVITWIASADKRNQLQTASLAIFFFEMHRRRDEIVRAAQEMHSKNRLEFERTLDRVEGVASRTLTMSLADQICPPVTSKRWNRVQETDMWCSCVEESLHDYTPSTEVFDKVSFPGAAYIEVSFDPRTSTASADWISFFKDEDLTDTWGVEKRYSGPGSGSWPGFFGRPSLIIPADKFWYRFSSSSRAKGWGFKFMARARVSVEMAKEIKDKYESKNRNVAPDLLLLACQIAIKEAGHIKESADQLVLYNMPELLQKAEHEMSERAKSWQGMYENDSGVRINAQTCEMTVNKQIMKPCPPDVQEDTDFVDALGVLNSKDDTSVMVTSQQVHENAKFLSIQLKGQEYVVEQWTNKLAKSAEQLYAEKDKETWQMRLTSTDEGTKDGEDEAFNFCSMDTSPCLYSPTRQKGPGNHLLWMGCKYLSVALDKVTFAPTEGPSSAEVSKLMPEWAERLFFPYLNRLGTRQREEGVTEMPSVWVRSQDSGTGAECGPLLAYLPPTDERSQKGILYEVVKVAGKDVLHWYEMKEVGVFLGRSLCMTSDCRWSYACSDSLGFTTPMTQVGVETNYEHRNQGNELPGPWPKGELHSASRSTRPKKKALVISRKRSRVRVKDEQEVAEETSNCCKEWNIVDFSFGHKVHSSIHGMDATGRRTGSADPGKAAGATPRIRAGGEDFIGDANDWFREEDVEVYLSVECLLGIIPSVLLDAYKFWKTGDHRIRGYPRTAKEICKKELRSHENQFWAGSQVRIDLVPGQYGASEMHAFVYRLPQHPSSDESVDPSDVAEVQRLEMCCSAVQPMTLLDALNAPNESVLFRLASVFSRVEFLSHLLFWSKSGGIKGSLNDDRPPRDCQITAGDPCEVSRVELPRLGLSFNLNRDYKGVSRMYCQEESGLFLSDEHDQARLLLYGIFHSLLLENDTGDLFVLVPNTKVLPAVVSDMPFSNSYHCVQDSTWCHWMKKKYFVYEVHKSGKFLKAPPTLSAGLYLIHLYHQTKDFVAAARVMKALSGGTVSQEEKHLFKGFLGFDGGDPELKNHHPDQVACELRQVTIYALCDQDPPATRLHSHYELYLKKQHQVHTECRLSSEEELLIIGFMQDQRMRLSTAVEQRLVFLGHADQLKNEGIQLEQSSKKMLQGQSYWREVDRHLQFVLHKHRALLNEPPPRVVGTELEVKQFDKNSVVLKWKAPQQKGSEKGDDDTGQIKEVPMKTEVQALEAGLAAQEEKSELLPLLGFRVEVEDGDGTQHFGVWDEWTKKEKGTNHLEIANKEVNEGVSVGLCTPGSDGEWSVKVGGLSPHQKYKFRVRAVNRAGASPLVSVPQVFTLSDEKEGGSQDEVSTADEPKGMEGIFMFGNFPITHLHYKKSPGRPEQNGSQTVCGMDAAKEVVSLQMVAFSPYLARKRGKSNLLTAYDIILGNLNIDLRAGGNQVAYQSNTPHTAGVHGDADDEQKSGNRFVKCPRCFGRNDPRRVFCSSCLLPNMVAEDAARNPGWKMLSCPRVDPLTSDHHRTQSLLHAHFFCKAAVLSFRRDALAVPVRQTMFSLELAILSALLSAVGAPLCSYQETLSTPSTHKLRGLVSEPPAAEAGRNVISPKRGLKPLPQPVSERQAPGIGALPGQADSSVAPYSQLQLRKPKLAEGRQLKVAVSSHVSALNPSHGSLQLPQSLAHIPLHLASLRSKEGMSTEFGDGLHFIKALVDAACSLTACQTKNLSTERTDHCFEGSTSPRLWTVSSNLLKEGSGVPQKVKFAACMDFSATPSGTTSMSLNEAEAFTFEPLRCLEWSPASVDETSDKVGQPTNFIERFVKKDSTHGIELENDPVLGHTSSSIGKGFDPKDLFGQQWARGSLAKTSLDRLVEDFETLPRLEAGAEILSLSFLSKQQVKGMMDDFAGDASAAKVKDAATSHLNLLCAVVRELRKMDGLLSEAFIEEKRRVLKSIEQAEAAAQACAGMADSQYERRRYSLELLSGRTCAYPRFELLAASLVSNLEEKQWLRKDLETDSASSDVLQKYGQQRALVHQAMLRVVRVGQIQQCAHKCRQLLASVKQAVISLCVLTHSGMSPCIESIESCFLVSGAWDPNLLGRAGADTSHLLSSSAESVQKALSLLKSEKLDGSAVGDLKSRIRTLAMLRHSLGEEETASSIDMWLKDNAVKLRYAAMRQCYVEESLPDLQLQGTNGAAGGINLDADSRRAGSVSISFIISLINTVALQASSLASQIATKRSYFRRGTSSACLEGSAQKLPLSGDINQWWFDQRLLVFEFMTGTMLRNSQLDLVADFQASHDSGQSKVRQLIMGSGKTTVLVPLLSMILADTKRLVVNVVPNSLLPMTKEVCRKIFGVVVTKRVHTLNFGRSPMTLQECKRLVQKLERIKQHGDILCATPGAIKSLMLKYMEMLESVESTSTGLSLSQESLATFFGEEWDDCKTSLDALVERVQDEELIADQLQRALALLREGTAIVDEVDWVLHPLKSETNFPIGDKQVLPMDKERVQLPIHLLDGFMYAVHLQQSISLPNVKMDEATLVLKDLRDCVLRGFEECAVQKSPHPVLLKQSFYSSHMVGPVADWALVWLRKCPQIEQILILENDPKSSSGVFEQVPGEARKDRFLRALKCYMLNNREGSQLLYKPKSEHEAKLSHAMPLINLARLWVTILLPHCISKRSRIDFGLLQTDDIQRWQQDEQADTADGDDQDEDTDGPKKSPWDKFKMPLSRKLLAVPFLGKDIPSRVSEFSSPDVVIGLTLLAYLYEGLRFIDVKSLVLRLKKDMSREKGPPSQRQNAVLFKSWLDDVMLQSVDSTENLEALTLDIVQPGNEKQMLSLQSALGHFPPVLHRYLEHIAFPETMKYQTRKLQASGMDIGSRMLFKIRLGFSGTPNSLLPTDLGKCNFEPGSEARIVKVLTSPEYLEVIAAHRRKDASKDLSPCAVLWNNLFQGGSLGWTVEMLLEGIAKADPPYHALIDTGALITGYSSEGVARFLLTKGLERFRGCVFLDKNDRKMVVVRSDGHLPAAPVPFDQCGLKPEERFTFFDQIHTTGVDVPQAIDARAITTVGKGMTLRDHAQGCWRMRGLEQGQRIDVLLVHEMAEMVTSLTGDGESCYATQEGMLNCVVSWLIFNGIESEKQQHAAFSVQRMTNVWREKSFQLLMASRAVPVAMQPSKTPEVGKPLFISRFTPQSSSQRQHRTEDKKGLCGIDTQIRLLKVKAIQAKIWREKESEAKKEMTKHLLPDSFQEFAQMLTDIFDKMPINSRGKKTWLVGNGKDLDQGMIEEVRWGKQYFAGSYGTEFAMDIVTIFLELVEGFDDEDGTVYHLKANEKVGIAEGDVTTNGNVERLSSLLRECVAIFVEEIDTKIDASLEQKENLLQKLTAARNRYRDFMSDDCLLSECQAVIDDLKKNAKTSTVSDGMDQENEQENEQEFEQETIMEDALAKFLRSSETATRWNVSQAASQPDQCSAFQSFDKFKLLHTPWLVCFDASADRHKIKAVEKKSDWHNLGKGSFKPLIQIDTSAGGQLIAKVYSVKTDASADDVMTHFSSLGATDISSPKAVELGSILALRGLFHDNLYATKNYGLASKDFPSGTFRMHNTEVLLLIKTSTGKDHYVTVTLDEMEGVRRAILMGQVRGMQLFTLAGDAITPDDGTTLVATSDGDQFKDVRDMALMFDGYQYFDNMQLLRILSRFSSQAKADKGKQPQEMLAERSELHDCLVNCRRRLNKEWRQTPLATVMTRIDVNDFKRVTEAAETLKKRAQVYNDNIKIAFAMFDRDGNGRLDHDELREAFNEWWPDCDLNWDSTMTELMELLDPNGLGGVSFSQFSAFFLDKASGSNNIVDVEQGKAVTKKTVVRLKRRQTMGKGSVEGSALDSLLKERIAFSQSNVTVLETVARVPHHLLISSPLEIADLVPAASLRPPSPGAFDAFKVISNDILNTETSSSLVVQGNTKVSTDMALPVTVLPRAILVSKQSAFFEVELAAVSSGSTVCIGWADATFRGGMAGSDGSWAISGTANKHDGGDVGSAFHGNLESRFGCHWKSGDVIGCHAEFLGTGYEGGVPLARLSFSLNGSSSRPMGVPPAFARVEFKIGLIPVVSYSVGAECHINLGTIPFRHPPNDAKPVSEFALEKAVGLIRKTAGDMVGEWMLGGGPVSMEKSDDTAANRSRLKITYTRSGRKQMPATLAVRGCPAARGKWFFEVKLEEPWFYDFTVGWTRFDQAGISKQLGEHEESWGLRVGYRNEMLTDNKNLIKSRPHFRKFFAKQHGLMDGLVIGSCVDLDRAEIKYYARTLEGHIEDLGVAFTLLKYSVGLVPAVSCNPYYNYSIYTGKTLVEDSAGNDLRPSWAKHFRPFSEFPHDGDPFSESLDRKKADAQVCRVTSGVGMVSVEQLQDTNMENSFVYDVQATSAYPSIKIDRACLNSGCWYFEIKIVSTTANAASPDDFKSAYDSDSEAEEDEEEDGDERMVSFGWSDKTFFGDCDKGHGVGDDRFSVGYCGLLEGGSDDKEVWCLKKHKSNIMKHQSVRISAENPPDMSQSQDQTSRGSQLQGNPSLRSTSLWREGDILGCVASLDGAPRLGFVHWRKDGGQVAQYVSSFESIRTVEGLSPTVTLIRGFSVRISLEDNGEVSAGFVHQSFESRKDFAQATFGLQDMLKISFNLRSKTNSVPTRQTRAPAKKKTELHRQFSRLRSNPEKKTVDNITVEIQTKAHVEELRRNLKVSSTGTISAKLVLCNEETSIDCVNAFFELVADPKFPKERFTGIVFEGKNLGGQGGRDKLRALDFSLEAALASCSNLEDVKMLNCYLGMDTWGICPLTNTIDDHESLVTLDLSNTDPLNAGVLGPLGATALANALCHNRSIETLVLSGNAIESAGARQLCLSLDAKSHALSSLDLSNNGIDSSASSCLQRMLTIYPKLTDLNLSRNQIQDGLNLVAEALEQNDGLSCLDISYTRMGSGPAKSMAQALAVNNSLTRCDLRGAMVGSDGIRAMEAAFIEGTHSVEKLLFKDTSVSDQDRVRLLFSLNRKPMKLIHMEDLICLDGHSDWNAFFHMPLSFSVWCLYARLTPEDHSNPSGCSTVYKSFFQDKTFVSRNLALHLIRERNSMFVQAFGSKNQEWWIEGMAPIVKPRVGSGSDRNEYVHVSSSDAASALKLAICMLRENAVITASELLESPKHSAVSVESHADPSHPPKCPKCRPDLTAAKILLDAMIGRKGTSGLVHGCDKLDQGFAVRPGMGTVEGSEDVPEEVVKDVIVDYVRDLWCCNKASAIKELKSNETNKEEHDGSNQKNTMLKLLLGDAEHAIVTPLLCALSLDVEEEEKYQTAERLLQRNRHVTCRLRDEHGVEYERVKRSEAEAMRGNEATEPMFGISTFVSNPDIVNINARWILPAQKKLDAIDARTKLVLGRKDSDVVDGYDHQIGCLALAARNGMGRIVHMMRFSKEFRCKQDWEIQDWKVKDGEVSAQDNSRGIRGSDAPDGLTSLHHVCQAPPGPQVVGMIPYARELWENDMTIITKRDSMGRLALHYACVNGHDSLVKEMLLKVRSSEPGMVDYYDKLGWTASALAAMHGHARCLELLVLSGARLTQSGVLGGADMKTIQLEEDPESKQMDRLPGFSEFHSDAHDVCFMRHIVFERRHAEVQMTLNSSPNKENGKTAIEAEELQKSVVVCEEMRSIMNTHSNDVRRERNERVMRSLFAKILKYIPFLIILTFVALASSKKLSWSAGKFALMTMENVMFEFFPEDSTAPITFAEVVSQEEMWSFLHGPFVGYLWPEGGFDGPVDASAFLFGAVRFKQHRVKGGPCKSSDTLPSLLPAQALAEDRWCRGSEADDAPYGPNGTWVFDAEARAHVVDLPAARPDEVREILAGLENEGWVDDATQHLSLQFSLYNTDIDAMLVAFVGFRLAVSGGVEPFYHFAIMSWTFGGVEGVATLVLEMVLIVICLGGTLWYLVKTGRAVLVLVHSGSSEQGRESNPNAASQTPTQSQGQGHEHKQATVWERVMPWWMGSVEDFLSFFSSGKGRRGLLLFTAAFILDLWCILRIMFHVQKNALAAGRDVAGVDTFIELDGLSYLVNVQYNLLGLALVCAWIYTTKYLQLLPVLGPMIQAVTSTLVSFRVLSFIGFVFFFCWSFALGCYVIFGFHFTSSFFRHDNALLTVMSDNYDLDSMQFKNFATGSIAFIAMYVIISLTLLNIFIGLTGEVYGEQHKESERVWEEKVSRLIQAHFINNEIDDYKKDYDECKQQYAEQTNHDDKQQSPKANPCNCEGCAHDKRLGTHGSRAVSGCLAFPDVFGQMSRDDQSFEGNIQAIVRVLGPVPFRGNRALDK